MDVLKDLYVNMRITAEDKELFERAAGKERRSLTSFLTIAALERAKDVLGMRIPTTDSHR